MQTYVVRDLRNVSQLYLVWAMDTLNAATSTGNKYKAIYMPDILLILGYFAVFRKAFILLINIRKRLIYN